MAHKDEELTERLVDFDHHGIDYQSRVDLRMQSWEAIRRLRAENAALQVQVCTLTETIQAMIEHEEAEALDRMIFEDRMATSEE